MSPPYSSSSSTKALQSDTLPSNPPSAVVTAVTMKLDFRRFLCCVSAAGPQGTTSGASGDGGEVDDHISRLPNDVLSSIVTLLPARDGARTALLSSQWLHLWASTPLVLDDSDLLLADNFVSVSAVAATISGLIDAHPGPFRSVSLTCYLAECDQDKLTGWIQALATKGVHELALNNVPWSELDVLPAALFLCSSLERFYVSCWRFPDTDGALPVVVFFPRLREFVLCNTMIKAADLERMLTRSPVVRNAVFIGSGVPAEIHLRSSSLRCIVFWYSATDELDVVSAPLLERIILWDLAALHCRRRRVDHRMTIKLSRASSIRMVGYLNPSCHQLLVENTVIKAGMKTSPEVAVPSVKILGLAFRFGVARESGMVPSILGCFPNIETLHLMSRRDNEISTRTTHGCSFEEDWKDFGSVECVRSIIKKVMIHGFRWEVCEMELLKCIVERGKEIKNIYIFDGPDEISERDDKMALLASLNLGGTVTILSGEDSVLTYGLVSDLARIDPFDCSIC